MNPAVLILAAFAAYSSQSAETPVVAPASDALVERFMAVIPDSNALRNPQWDIDPAQVTRLTELNPDRAVDIEAVRETYRRCTSPTAAAVTLRLFRDTAGGLGDEKLGRLIAFYQSEDFTKLRGISERGEAGETLSEAGMAEAERITSAYPVRDYMESLSRAQMALFQDEALVGTILRCEEEMRSALASRGLRDE